MPRTAYSFPTDELLIWMFEHGWSRERTALGMNVPICTLNNWLHRSPYVPNTIGLILAYLDLYGEWNGPARPRKKPSRDRKKMTPRPKVRQTKRGKFKYPSIYRPMDYYELNSWRGRLHLSGPAAARILRCNASSMLRWQCNRSSIPSWMRRACNFVERYGPLDEYNQPVWAHWVKEARLESLSTGESR